jgi:small subunit ribosomal protein S15
VIIYRNFKNNMLTVKKKANIIKKTQLHATDTGSPEVQVGILSRKIEDLASHLKDNKKDNHSRRGLMQMLADRRKHLKYLSKTDAKRYNKLVKELDL